MELRRFVTIEETCACPAIMADRTALGPIRGPAATAADGHTPPTPTLTVRLSVASKSSSTIHGRVLTPSRTVKSTHRSGSARTPQQDRVTSSKLWSQTSPPGHANAGERHYFRTIHRFWKESPFCPEIF